MKFCELEPRQHAIMRLLLQRPGISRVELSELFKVNKMTAGRDIQVLMQLGLVCESGSRGIGRGRPQQTLELDVARRTVLGVAVLHDRLEGCRTTITGEAVTPKVVVRFKQSKEIPASLSHLLGELNDPSVLTIALTAGGFIDATSRKLLLNAVVPSHQPVDLSGVFGQYRPIPIVVENDMSGLAAKWILQHRDIPLEDTLFVKVDDGSIGACLLVRGLPNEGCIVGGNELGHTCVSNDEVPCYCGQKGCVERIFSREYLIKQLGGGGGDDLVEYMSSGKLSAVGKHILAVVAQALANAINFTRAGRVVLATSATKQTGFYEELLRQVHKRLLEQLKERVRMDIVPGFVLDPAVASAATGALRLYLSPNQDNLLHVG